MCARYRLALVTLVATALAVVGSTSALAAAPATHHDTAVTAVAPRAGPHPGAPQGWDRHPDRHGRDHGAWRGRGWDHRGYGWDWERQCRWAYRHDRLWWITHCR